MATNNPIVRVFILLWFFSIWFGASATAQPAPAKTQIKPELLAAANALGMVRGAREVDLTAIHFVIYQGAGTLLKDGKSRAVTNYELSADYTAAALRTDATLAEVNPADKKPQRLVEVVRGSRAWDETEPGVKPVERTATAALQRQLQLYATPIGAISAAIEADPKQVSVTKAGERVLISAQKEGVNIKITLDAEQRPENIIVTNRAGTLTATYSGYRDYEHYFVFHPSRMTQRIAGKVVLDVTLSAAYSNPYVAFPTPEQLAKAQ